MKSDNDDFGILFVDDEEQTAKYFSRAYSKEFPVLTAGSAKEGMAILDENSERIAILITDQRMPEARGVELLKYARREYPNIVRILTTAYTDLDDAIEAVNSGEIHRYVTKPWDISALMLELKQAMQFFLIRGERDELLREKLSAWQRLEGVNRVREMVSMACSVTVARDALGAARSFIEQIPTQHPSDATSDFGSWAHVPGDLQKLSDIGREVTDKLAAGKSGAFESVPVARLFEQASNPEGRVSTDPAASSVASEVDPPLLASALSFLLEWAASNAASGSISASASEEGGKACIRISVENGSWGGASLMDFPSGLLAAYFAFHDQGGALVIGDDGDSGFTIEVHLPLRQQDVPEASRDLSWLEKALSRFENW